MLYFHLTRNQFIFHRVGHDRRAGRRHVGHRRHADHPGDRLYLPVDDHQGCQAGGDGDPASPDVKSRVHGDVPANPGAGNPGHGDGDGDPWSRSAENLRRDQVTLVSEPEVRSVVETVSFWQAFRNPKARSRAKNRKFFIETIGKFKTKRICFALTLHEFSEKQLRNKLLFLIKFILDPCPQH